MIGLSIMSVAFFIAAVLSRLELHKVKKERNSLASVNEGYEIDLKRKADELSAIDRILNVPALDVAKDTTSKVALSVLLNRMAASKGFIPNNEKAVSHIHNNSQNETINGTNSGAANSGE